MGRNAAKCVPFKAKEGSEEPEGDYYQLAAILCAMAGMFWRLKLLTWCGVFFSFASVATRRSTELTFFNIASSLMVSVASLFMNYMAPAAAKAPAGQ